MLSFSAWIESENLTFKSDNNNSNSTLFVIKLLEGSNRTVTIKVLLTLRTYFDRRKNESFLFFRICDSCCYFGSDVIAGVFDRRRKSTLEWFFVEYRSTVESYYRRNNHQVATLHQPNDCTNKLECFTIRKCQRMVYCNAAWQWRRLLLFSVFLFTILTIHNEF